MKGRWFVAYGDGVLMFTGTTQRAARDQAQRWMDSRGVTVR